MSQKLSFDIKFQKEIDRCQYIIFAYSAIGTLAKTVIMLIQETVNDAKMAFIKNDMAEMIRLYKVMKEIKK